MVMLMLSHQPRPVYHIFEFSSLLLLTTRRPFLMFWTFVLVLLGLSSSAAQWLFSISSSKWLFSIHQQVSHGLNELPLSVVQAMATNWQNIACNHQQPLCHPVTDLDFELHGRFICALPISSNRSKPTQNLYRDSVILDWKYQDISWPLAAVKHRSLKSSNAQWALLTFAHILYSLSSHR